VTFDDCVRTSLLRASTALASGSGPLRLPHAEIALADLRGRCVMTTYDPVSGDQDPDVLRDIVRRFGGRLCLNAEVRGPGHVNEGDPVEFLSHAMQHAH
jgi:hypothetical protein